MSKKYTAQKAKKQINYYTYLIRSDYYPEEFIDNIFQERGNWIKVLDSQISAYKNSNVPIDFIYLDGLNYLNPLYYSLTSNLKNIANDGKRIVSFKNVLINTLSNIPAAKKYVMPQLDVDLYDYIHPAKAAKFDSLYKPLFDGDQVYIFKPVTGMRGMGIKVFTKFADFKKYCMRVISNHGNKWGNSTPNKETMRVFVLQEYITDPLLIKHKGKGYKFHIRHFFIYQPGTKHSFYKNIGKMALAEEPYKQADWTNKKIHDTHFLGVEKMLFTPEDTGLSPKIIEHLNKQIHSLYKILNKLIKAHAGCYTESKHCYQLLGVDFMVTSDYKIKILETNASLGIGGNNMNENKAELFKGIVELVVDQYFPPAIPPNSSVASAFTIL